MLRFRKDFNTKIVLVLVAIVFLLNTIVYGIDLPYRSHLRVPSSFEDPERLQEALLELTNEAVDKTIIDSLEALGVFVPFSEGDDLTTIGEIRKLRLAAIEDFGKVDGSHFGLKGEFTVIPITDLLERTGQMGHIGLSDAYGETVIYLDRDLYEALPEEGQTADSLNAQAAEAAINHELKTIALYREAVEARRFRGIEIESVTGVSELRGWMRGHGTEAYQLNERIHNAANDTPGCDLRPFYENPEFTERIEKDSVTRLSLAFPLFDEHSAPTGRTPSISADGAVATALPTEEEFVAAMRRDDYDFLLRAVPALIQEIRRILSAEKSDVDRAHTLKNQLDVILSVLRSKGFESEVLGWVKTSEILTGGLHAKRVKEIERKKAEYWTRDAVIYEVNARTTGAHRDAEGRIVPGIFRQIIDQLDEVQRLGFNAVYLMGIHPISDLSRRMNQGEKDDIERDLYYVRDDRGEIITVVRQRYEGDPTRLGSPFSIVDYLTVNPELGLMEDFRELVRRAHQLGIRIFVDFVLNHTAIDSPLLEEHPEWYIYRSLGEEEKGLSDEELLDRYPEYFVHYSKKIGRIMVAHGKDPWFEAWRDTAQLNYANPELREYMIDVMKHWAGIVDGGRFDMAMLLLRGQIKTQWHATMPSEEFDEMMPGEFWEEAITAVKEVEPGFAFMAEAYWQTEGYLQQLGFDLTYDKHLYDLLQKRDRNGIRAYLHPSNTPPEYLEKTTHFIEAHDELRARASFGEASMAAATIIVTIPGTPFIHEGQLEGYREKLAVQKVIPSVEEDVDEAIYEAYTRLLTIASDLLFRRGEPYYFFDWVHSNFIAYARRYEGRRGVVVVNYSPHETEDFIPLDIEWLEIKEDKSYRITDRLTGTHYVYSGEDLKGGLYVKLPPWSSHVFEVELESSKQASTDVVLAAATPVNLWDEPVVADITKEIEEHGISRFNEVGAIETLKKKDLPVFQKGNSKIIEKPYWRNRQAIESLIVARPIGYVPTFLVPGNEEFYYELDLGQHGYRPLSEPDFSNPMIRETMREILHGLNQLSLSHGHPHWFNWLIGPQNQIILVDSKKLRGSQVDFSKLNELADSGSMPAGQLDLAGADLRRTPLRYMDLVDADLGWTDLRDVDLHGVDMSGAELYGADLRDAQLQEAKLTFAFIWGADLRGAKLGEILLYETGVSVDQLEILAQEADAVFCRKENVWYAANKEGFERSTSRITPFENYMSIEEARQILAATEAAEQSATDHAEPAPRLAAGRPQLKASLEDWAPKLSASGWAPTSQLLTEEELVKADQEGLEETLASRLSSDDTGEIDRALAALDGLRETGKIDDEGIVRVVEMVLADRGLRLEIVDKKSPIIVVQIKDTQDEVVGERPFRVDFDGRRLIFSRVRFDKDFRRKRLSPLLYRWMAARPDFQQFAGWKIEVTRPNYSATRAWFRSGWPVRIIDKWKIFRRVVRHVNDIKENRFYKITGTFPQRTERLSASAADREELIGKLRQATDDLAQEYPELLGFGLFGGWAKGTATQKSDVDLVLITDQDNDLREEAPQIVKVLEDMTGLEVDLMVIRVQDNVPDEGLVSMFRGDPIYMGGGIAPESLPMDHPVVHLHELVVIAKDPALRARIEQAILARSVPEPCLSIELLLTKTNDLVMSEAEEVQRNRILQENIKYFESGYEPNTGLPCNYMDVERDGKILEKNVSWVSPTDIALYIDVLVAVANGDIVVPRIITANEAMRRLCLVVQSLESAPKSNGFFYCYELTNGEVAISEVGGWFISTIDNGNLAASLAVMIGAFRNGTNEQRVLAGLAMGMLDAMDWSVLYNPDRKLLRGGYYTNIAGDITEEVKWCIDRKYNEGRIAAMMAILSEKVPQDAWLNLTTTYTPYPLPNGATVNIPKPWNAGAFQAWLPLLFFNELKLSPQGYAIAHHNFLIAQANCSIDESLHGALLSSAYSPVDGEYYEYGPLSLAEGKTRTGVGAPYATGLAFLVSPHVSLALFRMLDKSVPDVIGPLGYYESVDLDGRVSTRMTSVAQGMLILSVAGTNNRYMQEYLGIDNKLATVRHMYNTTTFEHLAAGSEITPASEDTGLVGDVLHLAAAAEAPLDEFDRLLQATLDDKVDPKDVPTRILSPRIRAENAVRLAVEDVEKGRVRTIEYAMQYNATTAGFHDLQVVEAQDGDGWVVRIGERGLTGRHWYFRVGADGRVVATDVVPGAFGEEFERGDGTWAPEDAVSLARPSGGTSSKFIFKPSGIVVDALTGQRVQNPSRQVIVDIITEAFETCPGPHRKRIFKRLGVVPLHAHVIDQEGDKWLVVGGETSGKAALAGKLLELYGAEWDLSAAIRVEAFLDPNDPDVLIAGQPRTDPLSARTLEYLPEEGAPVDTGRTPRCGFDEVRGIIIIDASPEYHDSYVRPLAASDSLEDILDRATKEIMLEVKERDQAYLDAVTALFKGLVQQKALPIILVHRPQITPLDDFKEMVGRVAEVISAEEIAVTEAPTELKMPDKLDERVAALKDNLRGVIPQEYRVLLFGTVAKDKRASRINDIDILLIPPIGIPEDGVGDDKTQEVARKIEEVIIGMWGMGHWPSIHISNAEGVFNESSIRAYVHRQGHGAWPIVILEGQIPVFFRREDLIEEGVIQESVRDAIGTEIHKLRPNEVGIVIVDTTYANADKLRRYFSEIFGDMAFVLNLATLEKGTEAYDYFHDIVSAPGYRYNLQKGGLRLQDARKYLGQV